MNWTSGDVLALAVLAVWAAAWASAPQMRQWVPPERSEAYFGDPKRGAEQEERFKASHPMIEPEITWPINEGDPFSDYGHFRMNKAAAGFAKLGAPLVLPLPKGERGKSAAEEIARLFDTRDWKDGKLLRYSTLVPAATTTRPTRGWPLVIGCPGAGGVGARGITPTDLPSAASWAIEHCRANLPAIVVLLHPQERTLEYLEADGKAVGQARLLPAFSAYLELIDHLAARDDVDPRRISIFGHSMGGASVWLLLKERPNLFAAAAPLAGGIPLTDGDIGKLPHIPIWMFMGNDDPWVGSSRYTWAYAQLLKNGHKRVRYWEIQDIGHSDGALNLVALHEWLWSQQREPQP